MPIRRFLARLLAGSCFAAVLAFTVLMMVLAASGDPWTEAELHLFREAYPALSALPDFEWVDVRQDGSFILYTTAGEAFPATLPQEISALLRDRRWFLDPDGLLSLRKIGDDVFFITGGDVDDRFGYVISMDDAVSMAGLAVLERVDGSMFHFSTRK